MFRLIVSKCKNVSKHRRGQTHARPLPLLRETSVSSSTPTLVSLRKTKAAGKRKFVLVNTAKLDVGDTGLINGELGWQVRAWEHSGGMREDDGCCCGRCCCCCGGGGEAGGPHRRDDYSQYLCGKDARRQRTAPLLCAGIVLLATVTAAVLVTAVRSTPGCQPLPEPHSHSADPRVERQEKVAHPRAMLTAPMGNNTDGLYLKWESEAGRTFHHGGFTYSNGDLVVPQQGFYRVFLQITYRSTTKPCTSPIIYNSVLLFHEAYTTDRTLLTSFDTVDCSMEQWSKSLYTSGIFNLQANSRLRVKSSHREYIAKNEQLVFFGAELLPP